MKKKHKNYDFTTTFKSIFFNLFQTYQKQNPRKYVIYSVFTWVIWWRRCVQWYNQLFATFNNGKSRRIGICGIFNVNQFNLVTVCNWFNSVTVKKSSYIDFHFSIRDFVHCWFTIAWICHFISLLLNYFSILKSYSQSLE